MNKESENFPILYDKIDIDRDKETEQKILEKEVFILMATIYCQGKHRPKDPISIQDVLDENEIGDLFPNNKKVREELICRDCEELIVNSAKRTDRCKHTYYKTFCHECPTRCYPPDDKGDMKEIMHYSMKKIVKEHPIYSLRFMKNMMQNRKKVDQWKEKHSET